MYIYPTPTISRTIAVELFSSEYKSARRDLLIDKLLGRNNRLLSFPERQGLSNRKFLGVREIQVKNIIGTIDRNYDFDRKFRPLKSHLRERWVNMSTNLDTENWPPILVHKIGDNFYVEDGHHRTSVARSIGRAYISAEVWEYASDCSRCTNYPEQYAAVRCHSAESCFA
jgi:hypothetical protein